jgi:NAD-dependent dihydropyrimidine dehydrogenase PreA subunit
MPTPIIDEKKCTGCKTCVEICPMQVFGFDPERKKATVDRQKECIGCRACEVQCPQSAIKVKDE